MQPGGASPPPQLPELVTNPVASLRPFVAEVLVCGSWISVPALPAAAWVEQFMGDDTDLDLVFPGLCSEEDQDAVGQALLEGCLDIPGLQRLTLDLISQVAGRPWWVAVRMIQIAELRWSILGADLVLRRIDADSISFSAWLDALWVTIFNHLPQEKWVEMSTMIEIPPPSEAPEDPMESLEMSPEAFANLMRG